MKEKLTRQTIAYTDLPIRNFDKFSAGDTIIVSQKVKDTSDSKKTKGVTDSNKERLQHFQGTVIAITNRGISSMFTVRKTGAHGVAVERIFPYYAPFIHEIKVVSRGIVRRAKLYYIRHKVGKSAIIAKQTGRMTKTRESAEESNSAE